MLNVNILNSLKRAKVVMQYGGDFRLVNTLIDGIIKDIKSVKNSKLDGMVLNEVKEAKEDLINKPSETAILITSAIEDVKAVIGTPAV